MRHTVLLLLAFLKIHLVAAQLYIAPGAQLSLNSDALLVLDNISFNNNGTFEAGNGTVSFKGSQLNFIQGSEVSTFYNLHLNKTSGGKVILNRNANVTNHVVFSNGNLDLLGFILGLGQTGSLEGESETSRINGFNGQVQASRLLNAPLNVNVGNLGAIITSSQNLGLVGVYRGHDGTNVHDGINTPVYRYYQIIPAQNLNLNAAFRFKYFDAELNGNAENNLSLFQQTAPSAWINRGFSVRDEMNNILGQTGLDSLSRFAISSAGSVLPVQFTLFNSRCNNGKVVLTWHTASEQNSKHFTVQRSGNGTQWTDIGSIPASGNSNTQRVYAFTDNSPLANNYYRIAEYDVNGRIQYSGVLRSSCGTTDKFLVWPNPTRGNVYLSFVANISFTAIINVYDSKGSMVKEKRAAVLQGSNQLAIDLSTLPAGMYTIITTGNGIKNSTKVYKQ